MSYHKLTNPTGNSDDLLVHHKGQVGCCGDSVTENSYSNAATNLTTSAVEKIEIDGVEYTFTTPATTLAQLKAGVDESLRSAGYEDIESVGVRTSGTDAAAVVTIMTTATLTKLINAVPADIALVTA